MTFVGRVLRVAAAVAGAAVVLGGVLWLADDVLRGPPADSAQLRPDAGRSAGTSTYAAAEFAEHVTGVETEWEGDTAVRTVISTDLADDAAGRRIAVGIEVAHMQQLLADCVEKLPVVVVNDREGDEIRHGDVLSFSRQRGDDCPGRAPRTS